MLSLGWSSYDKVSLYVEFYPIHIGVSLDWWADVLRLFSDKRVIFRRCAVAYSYRLCFTQDREERVHAMSGQRVVALCAGHAHWAIG